MLPAIIDVKPKFANVYRAVAAGSSAGGLDVSISISIRNGLPFGELVIAGSLFGFEPDEFLAYLYQGGGLELQQALYDEHFDKNFVVIPVAITRIQAAGYFP